MKLLRAAGGIGFSAREAYRRCIRFPDIDRDVARPMRIGAYRRRRTVFEHDRFAIRIVASHDSSNLHNLLRSSLRSGATARLCALRRSEKSTPLLASLA